MAFLSSLFLVLAIIVAVLFALLVLITGKGDAMGGGGSVRTTYKGKATFDDLMGRATLILGVAFMALVLCYNIVSGRAATAPSSPSTPPISKPMSTPSDNLPISNNAATSSNTASNNSAASTNTAPATNNAPAVNTPATNTPATNAPATSSAPATNAPAGNAPATNAANK